jgi:GH18 family chitinase
MQYSKLAALLLIAFNVLAQTSTAAAALPLRLIAGYGYWGRTQNPPYSSDQIPFQKLTHINRAGVGFDASGELTVPDGFLEPDLLTKAHNASVKVILLLGGDFMASRVPPRALFPIS